LKPKNIFLQADGKNVDLEIFEKIDIRRGSGPSAAAGAKEINMNNYVFCDFC